MNELQALKRVKKKAVGDKAYSFDQSNNEITKTCITTDTLSTFETLVASEDLAAYVELLDGVVDISISFNDDGSVTMTVSQAR